MNRTIPLVALGAVVAAGAGWYAMQGGSGSTAAVPFTLAAEAQEAAAEIDTSRVQDMVLGSADAPVTVTEYASFTCPHCANFHSGVFEQLKANYIDTGKVQFVYREVYFDRFGLWAGMVARCGGPEKYFGVVDMIYDTQAEWTAGGDPATVAGNLRRIGLMAGIEAEQLDACLADGEMAQAMVAVYQQNAEADGIDSTPSFVIDGQTYNNMSYDDFARILDDKIGG